MDLGGGHGFGVPVDGGDADAFAIGEGGCDERIEGDLGWEGGVGEDGGGGLVGIGSEEVGGEVLAVGIAVGGGDGGEGCFEGGSEGGFGGSWGHGEW